MLGENLMEGAWFSKAPIQNFEWSAARCVWIGVWAWGCHFCSPIFWYCFSRQFSNTFNIDSCGFAIGLFPALPPPPTLCNMQGMCEWSGRQGCRFVPSIVSVGQFSNIFNIDSCGFAIGLFPALPPPPTLCNMQGMCEWSGGQGCRFVLFSSGLQKDSCGFVVDLFSALPPLPHFVQYARCVWMGVTNNRGFPKPRPFH